MVVNGKGEKVWVYFRYEKLLNFCYWFGAIGHVEDDCDVKPEEIETDEWPYGPHLRASPLKTSFHKPGSESFTGSHSSTLKSTSEAGFLVRR